MWKLNVFLHVAVLAMCAWNVLCLSDSERDAMIQAMTPLTQECLSECGVEDFDPKQGKIDPCLKKCFLTKVKVIDENGMVDQATIHKHMMEYIQDKDEAKALIEKFDKCFEEKIDNTTEGDEADMKRMDGLLGCMKDIHA